MGIQARRRGTRAFTWLVTLLVPVFMTSACGQTSTISEENADDAPPASAPEENAPADNQGDDQADDQDDAGSDDQADDDS